MGIWLISPWDPHYNPMEYPDNISPDPQYILHISLIHGSNPNVWCLHYIQPPWNPILVPPKCTHLPRIPDKSHKSSQLCPLFAWFVHIKCKLYRHDFASYHPWFIGRNPKCLMLKSNMFESDVIVMKFPSPPMIFPLSPHCAIKFPRISASFVAEVPWWHQFSGWHPILKPFWLVRS